MGYSRKRLLRYVLWFSALSLVPFVYIEMSTPVNYVFKHSNISGACVIPVLNPFDPSVMQYMSEPQPLICDPTPFVIHVDSNGLLQFDTSALKQLEFQESDLQCSYKIVRRHNDDHTLTIDDPVPFKPPFSINADIFYVKCVNKGGKTVQDSLLTNVAKDNVQRTVPVEADSPEQLSVILFGVDSVSRSAALRKLPNTVRYLRKELGAYDFKGHMKVLNKVSHGLFSICIISISPFS